MSLANDYRPKSFDDVVEQSLAIKVLKSMCSAKDLPNRNFLLTGPAGTGKAQPLTSKVLTPNKGFVNIGDINPGDMVYTSTGEVAEVSSIHPQGSRDIYQIVLEDNTCIEVSDEHNNVIEFGVYDESGHIEYKQAILTTSALFYLFESQKDFMCYIPSPINGTRYNIEHLSSAELDMFAHRLFKDRWRIRSVTRSRREDCQCIFIDHPDHTYISDNFIVTHNTTLARIMASELNDGSDDVIEVDAASHGGVDDIRALVEQAKIFPMYTKWKIFIIDEAHLVSQSGWGAFLKCIEENPGRSIFIFATTNPEKIPDTIISRVQLFRLSKISTSGIRDRLRYVVSNLDVTYTDDALGFIAKLASGGMRNALTSLDKVIAFSKDISIENVVLALNLPNYDDYFDLLSSYAGKNNESIARIIDTVYNSGINFISWFEGFHAFVLQVAKCVLLKNIELTTIPSYYSDRMQKYDVRHVNICVKLSKVLSELIYKLKTTQHQQETALTYLLFTF